MLLMSNSLKPIKQSKKSNPTDSQSSVIEETFYLHLHGPEGDDVSINYSIGKKQL